MPDRVVVINDASIATGGATALALASAQAFRERGLPVTLMAGDTGANAALADAGVEVIALGQARLLASPRRRAAVTGLYNTEARRMVADWIARFDTPGTVYHVHGWAQILSPSIFHALRPVIDRLVLSAHDFFLVCPNGSYSFLATGKVCPHTPQSLACVTANCDRTSYAYKLWRVARQAVRRVTLPLGAASPRILTIHDRMRPFLERGGVPGQAIVTVPNPVRPFLDRRATAETNREFLFIGRLENGKGPDLACAAARLAGAPLRIVGDGPMEAQLRRDYPEATFCGRLPHDAIAPMVAGARALVMPSRYPEPYGLVAVEALWSGVPVVAARTAFLTPDIEALGAGAACDPRDLPAFAQVLRTVAEDDLGARRMSLAAFEGTRHLGSTMDGWVQALLDNYETRIAGVIA
jgi:glycosyltransferase involved in cell wall biosynthesis